MKPIERICLLGLGEVGQKLAMDLHSIDGLKLAAFDILLADPASNPSRAIGRMPFLRPSRSTSLG